MNGIIFTTVLALAAAASGSLVGNCDPNGDCTLQERVADVALKTFPPYYERTFHPEFVSNAEGNRYCKIDSRLPELSVCEELSEEVEELAAKQNPLQHALHKNNPENFREKGAFAQFPAPGDTDISQINYGTNPQKLKNHKAVLRYLEKNFLQNSHFFDQSPEEIVETVKKTHELMAKGLPVAGDNMTPGKFRTKQLYITEDRPDNSIETHHAIMKKNGAKKGDLRAWDRSRAKMDKLGSFEVAYKEFTPHEKRVWKYLGHIPSEPEQIERKMLTFANQFKKMGPDILSRKKDHVEAAAWVHQQLGKIHPFSDANGRIARSWMNAVLQLGGQKAVVIPKDAAYTDAVLKDQKKKEPFSHFLKRIIDWNRSQPELLPSKPAESNRSS